MTNILTAAEAATILRCEADDLNVLDLLPQIDAYIKNATGHDWAADSPIHENAKNAARMLLVLWHENPGMMQGGESALNFGLRAVLVQLEAIALGYREFTGRNGAGGCILTSAEIGDTVSSLVGIIGVSGDQSAAFEEVISISGQIQQVSAEDLSSKWFRVYLISPGEL